MKEVSMRMRTLMLVAASLMGTASSTGSADYPHLRASVYLEVYPVTTCRVLVTAYNSQERQTDDTPFVTAANTRARWGVVAARWLPRRTRVRIPAFPDVQFVVEDRMHVRNWCKMDIWMERELAANGWGKQFVSVEFEGLPKGFSCPVQPSGIGYKCPEPKSSWGRKAAKPHCPSWVEGCPQEPVRIASVQ
jgi:3D (Asp-Asp-Asp) domain-containing protein